MTRLKINKFDIDSTIDRLEKLKAPVTKKTADAAGRAIVKAMKAEIKAGKSPIKGRRFKKLQEPYASRKGSNKPNLKLSGKFLRSLVSESDRDSFGNWFTVVFYNTDLSDDKEKGHRVGANGQHRRPTLPLPGKESFKKKIQAIYLKIFKAGIIKNLKK